MDVVIASDAAGIYGEKETLMRYGLDFSWVTEEQSICQCAG